MPLILTVPKILQVPFQTVIFSRVSTFFIAHSLYLAHRVPALFIGFACYGVLGLSPIINK